VLVTLNSLPEIQPWTTVILFWVNVPVCIVDFLSVIKRSVNNNNKKKKEVKVRTLSEQILVAPPIVSQAARCLTKDNPWELAISLVDSTVKLTKIIIIHHFSHGISQRDGDCKRKTFWDCDDDNGDSNDHVINKVRELVPRPVNIGILIQQDWLNDMFNLLCYFLLPFEWRQFCWWSRQS